MSCIDPVQSTTPCNSFPKLFGSSSGSSYPYHIDVYNDYLALAGSLQDNTITGITTTQIIPFLALTSITTGSKYYWAKTLSLKTQEYFSGVQFSTDGALLIAHGYSNLSYIVVFNVSSGNILSARGYSVGGKLNYNYLIRSMTVSSGASPMAYVLSDYQSGFVTSMCTRQHLFKFNPLTFSSAAVWIKQTSGSGNNCGHLGLVFGRSESLLYAFSWYNGASTVSLLDTNGNSQWQYSTPNGDSTQSNMIKFKQINAATDMVIATSGSSFINYNCIIHSSSSPYPVDIVSSKTYRDPALNSNRKLYALYLIDKDNAVSLIYDVTNGFTDLAKIEFQTPQVKYQRAFPEISTLNSAIFTSPTVYYTGSYDTIFYTSTKTSIFQNIDNYVSIVYSSDISQTSCYSIEPIMTPTPITMTILTTITQISSSIYETSKVSFVNDIQAYTTVDIDQSKLTKASWCPYNPLGPFTINTVTQLQTTFTASQGVSDSFFPISPFSATLNCGSYANTWTYSGVKNSDGLTLDPTNDLISVNPADGKIFVSKSKLAGTYIIKVIGTLPDLVTTTYSIFTIVITAPAVNTPPFFTTTLIDVTVPLKTSVIYQFPTISDPDMGDNPTISLVQESGTGKLPDFIKTTSSLSTLTLYPTVMTEVKAYTMIVILTDTHDIKQYSFKITVTNLPPKIITTFQSPVVLTFGQVTIYNLPISIDPEGLPYTTTIQSAPYYVSMISSTQLRINPTNCATDLQDQKVYIKLEDQEPSITLYSIDLRVNNMPPVFLSSKIETQNIQINTIYQQPILDFSDPEGCPLVFTFTPLILQQFMKIQGNQIIYSPTQPFQVGQHEVTLISTDNKGLFTNTTFSLIVYQPPKFTSSIVKQIDLMASNLANYTLPIMVGAPGEYILHSSALPSFVKFDSPLYTFLPDQVSDLGTQTISGLLFNPYTSVPFSFKVNVTNQVPQLSDQIPDQVIAINSQQSYFIPEVFDREGQTVTYAAYENGKNTLPSFATFIIGSKEFQFAPTELDPIKVYSITLDLKDSFGASSSSTFSVTLYNAQSFTNSAAASAQQESSTLSGQSINNDISLLKLIKKQNDIQTQILGLEIVKVTRDQKAQIKIINANTQKSPITDIIVLLSNTSFEMIVEQKNASYKIGFQIIKKDLPNSLIQVNLRYPDPQNLSISSSDKLIVRTPSRLQILKKQIQSILPEQSQSEAIIPPQVTQKFESKVTRLMSGGRLSFSENTSGNLAIGFIVQMVWMRLEDFSFLVINSMLSISIPGIPSIILAVMIKYMCFDILGTEHWIEQFLTSIGIQFDQIKNDTALNSQFSENGFDSKQFLWNSGSSLFFLAFYIFLWIILFLLSILSKISTRMYTLKEMLKRQLIWKQSLNMMISQCQPLFLSSLLNMYDIRFKDNQNLTEYSSFISIFVLIFISTALLLILLKVCILTRNLNQESINQFKEQYSTLLESLKETKTQKMIFLWKPLTILRWVLTLTIIITLQDMPSFQILLLLILSAIWQCLILYAKPYETRVANIISFYNEVAASLYLYFGLLLTDFLETQVAEVQLAGIRLKISWVLTGILIFTIFVNLLYVVCQYIQSIFRSLKKKCCNGNRQQLGIMQKVEQQSNMSANDNEQSKTEGLKILDFEELKDELPQQNNQLNKKSEKNNQQNEYKNNNKEFYDLFELKQ